MDSCAILKVCFEKGEVVCSQIEDTLKLILVHFFSHPILFCLLVIVEH